MDQTLAGWHLVLALDDEPGVLSALRRALDTEPYDLVTADRPRIALEWARLKEVSLIVTDQRMPDMEGLRFLEEVWKESPDTAAIVLTAYPDTLPSPPGARLPEVIAKPWDNRSLRASIRKALLQCEASRAERAGWPPGGPSTSRNSGGGRP